MPWIQKRRISFNKDKKEDVKRHNSKWNKYYGNPLWKKLRHWYMSLRPLCVDCSIEGRSVPAEELHHSTPWSWWDSNDDKMKALLCPDLLVPLCSECHHKRHKYLKKPENFKETEIYKKIHNS